MSHPPAPSHDVVEQAMVLLRATLTTSDVSRIALLSSFGAESAPLLAMAAEINPAAPVLFLDTGKHFPQTLAYRDRLVAQLGLRDVRVINPVAGTIARRDPAGDLHSILPDDCCDLRKVQPLTHALAEIDICITGRRREQATTRTHLGLIEHIDGRTRINPLAGWTSQHIAVEAARRFLPDHPLLAHGYRSIGCAPCTRAVSDGDDPRSGRWAGFAKIECGIHARRATAA